MRRLGLMGESMSLSDKLGIGGENDATRVILNVGTARIPIDPIQFSSVVEWVSGKPRNSWETVVTPNLHHLRLIRSSPALAERYAASALSLADGWPVAWLASRVSGIPVDRVVGADLLEAIVRQPGKGKPLVLVGGTPGPGLVDLVDRCRDRGWNVHSETAPRDEIVDGARRSALTARIAKIGAGGVVVIGIGAPLQEALAFDIAKLHGAGVILCLGMSINFSSGMARRAPPSVGALRLEWVYRALREPKRLLPRYAKDAVTLPKFAALNRRSLECAKRTKM